MILGVDYGDHCISQLFLLKNFRTKNNEDNETEESRHYGKTKGNYKINTSAN